MILANRWDESALELASIWSAQNARVMTPRDLSRSGWRQRVGQPEAGTVVIGNDVIRQEEITGVLTRLPCIYKEELKYIAEADRSFVAAEMNAFLVFWLSSLTCPVINRPTSGCLNGPALSQERWMQAAARCGLRVALKSSEITSQPGCIQSVTVVGGRCSGKGDRWMEEQAGALARFVGVDFVAARFTGSEFLDVNLLPEIKDSWVREAVLQLFEFPA